MVCFCGVCPCDGVVPACDCAGVPVFQLWGCDAAGAGFWLIFGSSAFWECAVSYCFDSLRCACLEGGGRGVRPAAQWLSFASPKESHQRKGDPTVCDGLLGSEPQFTEPSARPEGAVLRTAVKWVSDPNNPQPAVLGAGGVSLELAPAALRQSRALIRHPLRAAGATRRGVAPNNHTGHRCARPGVPARGACAREEGPSAAMARVVCGCSTPCWLRLRRGACGVACAPPRACFVN